MTIETADMSDQEQDITAPGAILSLRRKELGWSEHEVAEKLCILPKQVIAIENNQFDTFSIDLFARGYLRAYAELVSVDGAFLLSLYEQHYQKLPSVDPPVVKPLAALPAHQPASRRYLGLAAVILVILALWYFSDDDETETIPEALSEIETPKEFNIETDSQIITTISDSLEGEVDEALVEVVSKKQVVSELATLQLGELNTVNSSEGSDSLVNVNATPLLTESDAASFLSDDAIVSRGSLQLKFSGDCWVEVRDAEGSVLFANMKRADDLLNISGLPPFRVLLGNATVVNVRYNGEMVNVNPSAENNSARITIGS